MDRFEELLKELGKQIDVPLHPDAHRICKLNINQVLHIQIEHDGAKERVLLATFICDLPPGKFREDVLKEALLFNNRLPQKSLLGYSERNNKLSLFEYFSIHSLTGEKMASSLFSFIEMADAWKRAIEEGRTSIKK